MEKCESIEGVIEAVRKDKDSVLISCKYNGVTRLLDIPYKIFGDYTPKDMDIVKLSKTDEIRFNIAKCELIKREK